MFLVGKAKTNENKNGSVFLIVFHAEKRFINFKSALKLEFRSEE